jgi:hypothetical protein
VVVGVVDCGEPGLRIGGDAKEGWSTIVLQCIPPRTT